MPPPVLCSPSRDAIEAELIQGVRGCVLPILGARSSRVEERPRQAEITISAIGLGGSTAPSKSHDGTMPERPLPTGDPARNRSSLMAGGRYPGSRRSSCRWRYRQRLKRHCRREQPGQPCLRHSLVQRQNSRRSAFG